MLEHEELVEAFREELEVNKKVLRVCQKDLREREKEVQVLKASVEDIEKVRMQAVQNESMASAANPYER